MTTETVEIAYAAPVTFLAGKSRTPKRQFVAGAFTVEVPRLDPASVRPVASGWALKASGAGRFPIDVIAVGDRVLAPFRAEAVNGLAPRPGEGVPSLDGFRRKMASAATNGFYLFEHEDPWPRNDPGKPLPPDVRTILEDGRPGMEAKVRARVAGLALHGDLVYCDRIEPVLNFRPAGGMDLAVGIAHDPEPRGYAFRLDRRAIAETAHDRIFSTGGYKCVRGGFGNGFDEVALREPESLRFREDVHNARVAATNALHHLGNTLAWMPTDLFPRLHALALARDGLASGASEPEDVARLLGEFEDARERIGGRLVQLKHVLAIGRDMIAMSLVSERVARLDGDDAEAIAGFAPR